MSRFGASCRAAPWLSIYSLMIVGLIIGVIMIVHRYIISRFVISWLSVCTFNVTQRFDLAWFIYYTFRGELKELTFLEC